MSPTDHGLWHLAVCASGICVCYLSYGLIFESLFIGDDRLGATFVLVTQCVTNTGVAYVWQKIKPSEDKKSLPLRHGVILLTAACYVGAMTCSNEAVHFVSYPVTALAKSCKLIPTMLVGQLVEGKFYSRMEWMAALLISAGIVLFQWGRMQQQKENPKPEDPNHQTYGILLLLTSLSLDGVLAGCQNVLKTPRKAFRTPTAVETMLYANWYAVFYLVPMAVYSGQWSTGIEKIQGNPTYYLGKLAVLNATVAVGQIFIFLTLQWYSPIMTTTITTTRKFLTILFSVWAYGHAFSLLQWGAVGLVFSGLYMAILMVQRKPKTVKAKEE